MEKIKLVDYDKTPMLPYTLGPEHRDYSIGSGVYMKIDNDLRKCIVFLGYEDNKGAISPKGTGFLFSYKDVGYLATVKHVAKALDGAPFIIRLNRRNELADNLYIGEAKWQYHPDANVDIAVFFCVITPKIGFDALYLPETMISPIGEKNIGIGDVCYTIGLFRFLTGKKRNLPIVHTGNIAMVPGDEKVPTKNRITKKTEYVEAYLVEAQSLDGLSGSPVFARPTIDFPFGRNDDEGILGSMLAMRNVFLIGIWQGAWNAPPDDIMITEIGMGNNVRVSVGMGVVVPITKLIELLEVPELQKQRTAIYAEREVKVHAAELDAVKHPSNQDNPQHKGDFNSLVSAAMKKKPQDD